MSRNIIRIKIPPSSARASKPSKASKAVKARRGSDSSSSSSLQDLSDDGGYSGVDDISDSEDDDEEHVNAAEEEHIIDNELRHHNGAPQSSPRPGGSDLDQDADADEEDDGEDEDDEDDDDDDDGDGEVANVEETDRQVDQSSDTEADGGGSWRGIQSGNDDGPESERPIAKSLSDPDVPNVERHVHFEGVPPSDSDSTVTETDVDDFFPDIFVAKDSLDSNFRREIEEDEDDDSSTSSSYWDLRSSYGTINWDQDADVQETGMEDHDFADTGPDDTTPVATPGPSSLFPAQASPLPSPYEGCQEVLDQDGYETDESDTTDEDVSDEPPARMRQPIQRVQEADESESEADPPTKALRGKPRVGRFNLDSSEKKPVCVVNPITRKMMIFTPQKLHRLDLSPESFRLHQSLDDFDGLVGFDETQRSPMVGNSGSLMLSAMRSYGAGDHYLLPAFGPAEAFFVLARNKTAYDSDSSNVKSLSDSEEKKLELEDFIDFPVDPVDEFWVANPADGGGKADDASSTPSRRPSAAPSATSDVSEGVHPLLSHFSNNTDVGAFRRNQVDKQLIFSEKATQESLAFSNPFYYGTLRGIKQGSMEGASTPLTPERRHRKSHGWPESPHLDRASQKRKASPASAADVVDGHKRQRSISDVQKMHL